MAKNGKKVRIFSALEVANICGVVNQTAINWIKHGHLNAFTTPGGQYRIYAEDLLDFLSSRGMRVPDELNELTKNSIVKRILIVDDDVNVNKMIRDYLNRKMPHYEIVQAFDGFEAGKALSEYCPQVVILDIDLPGVNGHSLCKKIKEDPELNDPTIISISGLSNPEERDMILAEGAEAFFPKPVDLEMLHEKIVATVEV